jgi:hypothetical protein
VPICVTLATSIHTYFRKHSFEFKMAREEEWKKLLSRQMKPLRQKPS